MAMEFRLPGGSLQHITMINTPTFPVARPEEFNALLVALKPDPKTGAPDGAKLNQFLAAHPTAIAQGKFLAEHSPPRRLLPHHLFQRPHLQVRRRRRR